MIHALFARRDHPPGYGFVQVGESHGRAHGYVVLAVRCTDPVELASVVERMGSAPFYGIPRGQYADGTLTEWYGGMFDFIGSFDGEYTLPTMGRRRFASLGDNRFVGLFLADEVLQAPASRESARREGGE